MFSLRFRYDGDRGKAYLEDGTAIAIKSFAPWERWVRKPSWKLKIGGGVAHDLERDPEDSILTGVSGGSGVSLPIPSVKDGFVYAMIDADGSVGHALRDGYRLGAGGSVGMLIPMGVSRFHASGSFTRFGAGTSSNRNQLKITHVLSLQKNIEARATFERTNHDREVSILGLFYY